MNVTVNLKDNIDVIYKLLPIQDSFDIILRNIKIGDTNASIIFIDGFAKDQIMYYIIQDLQKLDVKSFNNESAEDVIQSHIGYIEAETFTDFSVMTQYVLSGAVALLIDGIPTGIILDVREYPARNTEPSETEKVTRGSKDALVETIVFNTALIRRRVRDPNLVFSMKSVGTRSKSDVVIAYISDLASPELVQIISDKLDTIDIHSLALAEKSLEELIVDKKWYNPLPVVKYTERPDIIASYLMEGNICILVDTSPSAMIMPVSVFYFSQYAEDYYQPPLIGTYLRFIRFILMFLSLTLIPTWLLISRDASFLPESLQFIGDTDSCKIPIFLQLILLDLGFQMLRMSSLHTPGYLGTSFSILGGLLIGDFAVQVGYLVPQTIFYSALSGVAIYCIPSVDFALCINIFRVILLLMSGFFGWIGFFLTMILIIILMATTKTIDPSMSYLYPLYPFDAKALSNVIFRKPVTNNASAKKSKIKY